MRYKELSLGAGSGAILTGILALVLNTEGGQVNHSSDPGGSTNYGITEKTLGYDPEHITEDQAKNIYVTQYIEAPGFMPFIESQPILAYKLIDAGVNTGTQRSIKWFQTALNAYSRGCKDYPCITVDGIAGRATQRAWEALETKRGRIKACELVLKALDVQQGNHYLNLSRGYGKDFIIGWMDHRIENASIGDCQL